jgi:membrane fusion protein, macrolide-specific efflux system
MIENKSSRKKWIISAVVVVAIAGFFTYRHFYNGKPKIVYRKAKVHRGDIHMTILSTGSVAPENRLDLKPPVAGRVEKILVEEGQKVKSGQILAWLSSTERATLIDTARSQGKEELAYWVDAYPMTPMLAPSDGMIILKSADAGQTVTPTDIVLSMSDRLIVKANVDETDLAQIKNAQPVNMILDAFPEDVIESKVEHIGYDAKTVNNVTTYEVDVLANKNPEYMKSGMTANVTFLVDEKADTLIVPAAAVHKRDKKSYVLIPNQKNPDDSVEQEVEVGLSDGKRVEIKSGLEEGDVILIASLSSFGKEDNGTSPFSSFGNRGGGGGQRH